MTNPVPAVALAVLGAVFFAGAAVVQQRSVAAVVGDGAGGSLPLSGLRALLRRPRWLGGVALSAGGMTLHVAALTLAPLPVVQPVGVLAVPFAVLLVSATTRERPPVGVVVGVALTVAGVVLFVGPASGTTVGTPASGGTAALVVAVVAGVGAGLAGLARSRRPWVRCVAFATAGAVAFGLVSALLRAVVQRAGTGWPDPFDPVVLGVGAAMGVAVVVGSWSVQQGLAAGPPEVVLACLTVVDPIVAVVLGAVLLGESVAVGPWPAVAVATAVAGVLVLARHHPAAGRRIPESDTPVGGLDRGPLDAPGDAEGHEVELVLRRVVIGVDTYPPDVNGAARFAERLAAGLARRGHDVHVVAPSATGAVGVERSGRVTVHRLRSHRLPGRTRLSVCLPWEAGPAAAILLDELAPDVVHVQSHFVIGRALVAAAGRRGRAVVATNHVMPENLAGHVPLPQVLREPAFAWLWADLARVYRRAAVITAPTPRAAQLLVDAGLPDAVAVSCGIDADAYTDAYTATRDAPEDDRDGAPRVLFVGRLDDEKRVAELIRAFAALPGEPAARLEIVGEGRRRVEWTALAAGLGLGQRVRFRGFVPDDELVEAYRRAAVFVMPGVAELQSLATLEAMAAGTAVVAADAMALPHLVRPGYNGWLYPPGDVPALTARLSGLLADPAQRRRMGAAGRDIVAGHALDDTLATFEGLYRRALHLTGAHRHDRPAPGRAPATHADAVLVTHPGTPGGMYT